MIIRLSVMHLAVFSVDLFITYQSKVLRYAAIRNPGILS
jgi:hypothetical protein